MISRINSYNPTCPAFTCKIQPIFKVNKEPVNIECLNNLINKWDKQGKISDEDAIIIIPKKSLKQLALYDKNIAKTFPVSNLSDFGFAVALYYEEFGKINTRVLQYYNPKVITDLNIVHAIRNNKMYILPFKEEYKF